MNFSPFDKFDKLDSSPGLDKVFVTDFFSYLLHQCLLLKLWMFIEIYDSLVSFIKAFSALTSSYKMIWAFPVLRQNFLFSSLFSMLNGHLMNDFRNISR